ncbi:GerMN domain-containing protein [Candidatus Solincola tengchongensis]|uniref:GerMN domain-containing protein n=1 Tax=Candidatus Solincola tengchongensis TaxID=2900693 RepID=UPI00257BB993|nr:GerMN domain-containing protein [Candidatus Solincola tengchongensis]
MKSRDHRFRNGSKGRSCVNRLPAVLATAAGVCLFLLALLLGLEGARAQGETPPVPETPGEGVSQAGQVYFYLEGKLSPVSREVAGGPQAVEFTVMELLNGPKEEEKAQGYVTYIPEGVKLQYTTVKQDRSEYSVNLSRELLQLSGDRERALKALAQVVKTVRDASQIEKIGVTVAAEESGVQPADAFQALGVSPRDVEAEISGTSPSGGSSRLWLVLLLALGIPLLVLIAALAFILRKRASNPGEVRPVVGTAARPALRVKRRRGATPPPPAPWKEPRSRRKGRKRGKHEK